MGKAAVGLSCHTEQDLENTQNKGVLQSFSNQIPFFFQIRNFGINQKCILVNKSITVVILITKTPVTFIQYSKKLNTVNTRKESQFLHGAKPNVNWSFTTPFKTGQKVWQGTVS